jgi:Terminase large subunit, T4likevirus-type, N-terminal
MNWATKLELDAPTSSNSVQEEPAAQETSFSRDEVEKVAKESMDFLAALLMPTVFRYLFPPVFKSIWFWLLSYVHKVRDFSQLAIGLPRGFGKTMVIKLFVCYCVLFTKKKFIIIICGTQTKANNIITDIMTMLSERNILSVFGDWKLGVETDRQDLKRFGFRGRNIILMGAGSQSDIRGITLENERPDVMIFDDIQTREEAESEQVSKNIETWMTGTAMKAKSPHGCLFIFIANMYPTKHSLLRKLKQNPTWIKFIAGGILSDGSSLWEELQPVSQLLKEYENDMAMGRPEIFYSEVLNDENASVNNLVDLSKLPAYSIPEDEIHQGNFIVIDPATDKANADAVSITYFEIHNSVPVAKKIIEGRLSPGDTIAESLKIALSKNCRVIAIESNAYQYTLNYWFNFICQQQGIIGIEAVEIYSGSYSKNSRILTMFKQLLSGEILVHPSCQAQINLQISQFNPLKRDNTDGLLDCLTYAPKVIEMYGHLLLGGTIIEEQEFGKIKHPDSYELSNSPF